jgi:hypothetical protein
MAKPTDLDQGTLDLLILKTISLEPKHGWAIAKRIQPEIAPRRVTVDFQLFDDEWRRINVVRLVKPPKLRDPIAGF